MEWPAHLSPEGGGGVSSFFIRCDLPMVEKPYKRADPLRNLKFPYILPYSFER